MNAPEISITVPVFNNVDTLDELIDRLIVVLEDLSVTFEIILADDGSRDGTTKLLERRADGDSRIRPIFLARNFGSQAALCAAFDHVRGKRTVCLDADLENYPEDIPALLEKLDEGHDLVCGRRTLRSDSWLFRRLPSRLLNAYVRRQTGTHVRDVGCGMRAMDSILVRDMAAEGEHRRLITPLLLRRARSAVDHPIRHLPKGVPGGHSFFSLLGIAFDYYLLTARRPFLVSGLLSLVAVVAGTLAVPLTAGSPSAWIVLAGGALGALVSLIGEYAQRIYQLGQDLPFYQLRESASASEAPPVPASNPREPQPPR